MDPSDLIPALTIFNKEASRLNYFDLNEAQKELLETLSSGHNRILVVKARQLGISTLVRAWHFSQWLGASQPLKLGVVCHTREAAENLHNTDKTFLNNLPKKLQPIMDKSTAKTIRSKSSGAELKAFTAGAQGGTRSYVFSMAHLSEFPFYENPEETLATILAAVGDGQIVIESSPNMAGDLFNRLVVDAIAGKNEWKVVFFPWTIHSVYTSNEPVGKLNEEEKALKGSGLTDGQISWRRKQIGTLGMDKFIREYPRTIEEAFRSGKTTSYFWGDAAKEIKGVNLGSREDRKYKGDHNTGDRFIIGVDVSAGVGGDYSALSVVDIDTMQPVFHKLSNQITPRNWAAQILTVAQEYNGAKIIVEGNSYGAAVIEALKEWGYKNLYKTGDGKSFMTTGATRIRLFENMKQIIEDGVIVQIDRDLLDQIKTCIWSNGRPDHPEGSHDDLLFSTMLAYWGIKGKEPWTEKRENPIDKWKMIVKRRAATMPLPWKPTGYDYGKKKPW